MFQNACKSLLKTIMPIVVVYRGKNGKVKWGIGAGVPVNDEGWFVTAAHMLKNIAALDEQVASPISGRGKNNRVTHFAVICGTTNARLDKAVILDELDLGIGKLDGFLAPSGFVYPRFRVQEIEQGELLCRMGYSFVNDIRPTWSSEKGFSFANLFPVPLFVNEALVSRFVKLNSGTWIETSSPGLKGQSGGPLADLDGNICGIQVNTQHYPLDFEGAGRNQVLNVGRAVHVESVRQGLDHHGINYLEEEA